MIYDEKYRYTIINKINFDDKCLQCKKDGSKYKKYILVFYKENNLIKYIDIPDESYLSKFNNIIKTYNVEEIISTCINFDSAYEKLSYFHINELYFMKYIMNDENINFFKLNDDKDKIINMLK